MTFSVVVVIALIWTVFYEVSMHFLRKKRNYNRASTNILFFMNLVGFGKNGKFLRLVSFYAVSLLRRCEARVIFCLPLFVRKQG
jgi:hypothetical protein